nr:hypothetical protein [Tanacetum cinerariifolium]
TSEPSHDSSIVQAVDINTKPTSYAGAAGASSKGQLKFNSNFHPLVADPIYDDVNIYIPRKVVEQPTSYAGAAGASSKGQLKFNSNFHPLVADPIYDDVNIYIPRKVVEQMICKSPIIIKKWSMDTRLLKEELTYILIWVKLHEVPLQVFEEDGISLIATFIGKPVILDSYTSSMCNDSLGRSSFARCLIKAGKMVSVPSRIVIPSVVTHNTEKTNDGFQIVDKKKKKGKSKSTNSETFTSTVFGLTSQVAELKTLQWELLAEFIGLPSQISSVQKKIKTLDALPSLLNKVTYALNKFATSVENASSKAIDNSVPSADQAGASPAEGENNTKDTDSANLKQQPTTITLPTTSSFQSPLFPKSKGKEVMSSKDAKEEETKSDSKDDHANPANFMVESSMQKKLKKFSFVTKGGKQIHFNTEKTEEQKRIEETLKAELAKQEVENVKNELVNLIGIHAKLNKRSKDAGLSKDKSGLESPSEFQRSCPCEDHSPWSKSKRKRSEYQETCSDSEYEEGSEDAYEDLNSPYKKPKPNSFTERITRFKYHRRVKLPRNIRIHEGNKDLEDHLGIFSAATEQEEWPMPIWWKMFRQTLGGAARNWFKDLDPKCVDNFEELSQKFLEEFWQQKSYAKIPTEIHGIKRRQNEGLQAFMDRFKSKSSRIKGVPLVLCNLAFMHGHGHPELAKKLNIKIPKMVDKMFERVRAFIRGEVAARSAEMVRPSQEDKGYVRLAWTGGLEKYRNKGGLTESQRNMVVYAPYPRRDTFTPLTKTSKEILAMEIKKANKGAVALGKLAHPVKDICRTNQRNGSQGRKNVKIINMIREERSRKRPFEEGRSSLMNEITFSAIPWSQLTDKPIILEGIIEGDQVQRILVDGGSSLEIIYEHYFRNLNSGYTRMQAPGKGTRFMEGDTMASIEDAEEVFTIDHEHPDQYVMMGAMLTTNCKQLSANVLQENKEVFAWAGLEKIAVPRFVMEHQLKIYPFAEPMAHKRWPMASEGRLALKEKEYNQIRMAEDEEEKNGFHTEEGVYYFTHMLKELKNLAATLQRMMEKTNEAEEALQRIKRKLNKSQTLAVLKEGLAVSISKGMKDLHVSIDSPRLVAQTEGNYMPSMKQKKKYKK